jgi:hypothetical protein
MHMRAGPRIFGFVANLYFSLTGKAGSSKILLFGSQDFSFDQWELGTTGGGCQLTLRREGDAVPLAVRLPGDHEPAALLEAVGLIDVGPRRGGKRPTDA